MVEQVELAIPIQFEKETRKSGKRKSIGRMSTTLVSMYQKVIEYINHSIRFWLWGGIVQTTAH